MKSLANYTVVVAPDSGVYLAYAPAIKGCYALGETPETARAELELVFEMISAEYAQEGREFPPIDPR